MSTTTIAPPIQLDRAIAIIQQWHTGAPVTTSRYGPLGSFLGLSEERPASCWCGGRGGRDERMVWPIPGWDTDRMGELMVYGEYCSCADGDECRADEDKLGVVLQSTERQLLSERSWKGAGVPPHFADFTLDNYPATAATRPIVETLRTWLDGDRWLLLWGRFGGGKTSLAVAVFRELVYRGETGIFQTVPQVLDRIRETYDRDGSHKGEPSESDLVKALRDVDVLVLDDMGAERPSPWVAEKLFSLVNHRHDHHKRTIITSNLSPPELSEHVGERTVWRVIEMADVLKLDGPNLRDRSTA